MTSFLVFYQQLSCYKDRVYKIILKDDLVEMKVNNNIDPQPVSYWMCLQQLPFIVGNPFKFNPASTEPG